MRRQGLQQQLRRLKLSTTGSREVGIGTADELELSREPVSYGDTAGDIVRRTGSHISQMAEPAFRSLVVLGLAVIVDTNRRALVSATIAGGPEPRRPSFLFFGKLDRCFDPV